MVGVAGPDPVVPYWSVGPYATLPTAGSSVCQVTVAAVAVRSITATPVIRGACASGGGVADRVVKVKAGASVRLPDASVAVSRTWYVVAALRLLRVTPCVVAEIATSTLLPSALVGPYWMRAVVGSFVVQVTWAVLTAGVKRRVLITGGVVSTLQPWVSAGLFAVTPQALRSVQVRVWVPLAHALQAASHCQLGVQAGGGGVVPPRVTG